MSLKKFKHNTLRFLYICIFSLTITGSSFAACSGSGSFSVPTGSSTYLLFNGASQTITDGNTLSTNLSGLAPGSTVTLLFGSQSITATVDGSGNVALNLLVNGGSGDVTDSILLSFSVTTSSFVSGSTSCAESGAGGGQATPEQISAVADSNSSAFFNDGRRSAFEGDIARAAQFLVLLSNDVRNANSADDNETSAIDNEPSDDDNVSILDVLRSPDLPNVLDNSELTPAEENNFDPDNVTNVGSEEVIEVNISPKNDISAVPEADIESAEGFDQLVNEVGTFKAIGIRINARRARKERIAELKAKLPQLEQRIPALEARIKFFESRNSSIGDSGLKVAQNELAQINTEINKIESEIVKLQKKPLTTNRPSSNSPSLKGHTVSNENGLVAGSRFNPTGNNMAGEFYIANPNVIHPWMVTLGSGVSGLDDNRSGADRSSLVVDVTLNGYMLWDKKTSFGVSGNFRTGEVTSDATNSKQEGDYYTIAISAHRLLIDKLSLAASAAYTRGNNDLSVAGATGSFNVDVYSFGTTLSGHYHWLKYAITPKLAVAYSHSEREAYTDSTGALIPGSGLNQFNVTMGSEVSRSFQDVWKFDSLTPSVGINGGYFYRDDLGANLTSGTKSEELGYGVNFNSGVNFKLNKGLSSNIGASYGVFQDNLQTWSVTGNLVYNF